MKRLLQFDVTEDSYIILESGKTVFEIAFKGLRFDSRAFYQGIYAGGRSANIELEKIVLVPSAKTSYVYKWLNGIIQDIRKELDEGENSNEQGCFPEELSDEDCVPQTKSIILFDMAVCAGIGDFMGSQDSSGVPFETTVLYADYALRISGHSMEPTLKDGSIVLVKAIEEPIDGQIIVVNIDGKSMVKRYRVVNGQAVLVSDNDSREYPPITLDEENSIHIQGAVIEKLS